MEPGTTWRLLRSRPAVRHAARRELRERMSSARWNTVDDLFRRARLLPADERLAFLQGACGDDRELLGEVESLLSHECESFLQRSPFLARVDRRMAGTPAETRRSGVPVSSAHPEFVSGQRYRVRRLLGEGGQKQVFLARDSELEREVVVSVLRGSLYDPANLARIRREARTLARLGDHPHIVSIFDFDEQDGQPFIVTQYIDGGSVADLLKEHPGRPLPVEQAVRIAEEVCQALDHAHGQGIVHRDIKPANVLLTPQSVVKLVDFGLASSLDHSRLTGTGVAVGTASYMSPEQALGTEVGPASDLYSLGAMLYEMVTGAPPFEGDSVRSVISQHLNSAPVTPSHRNAEVPEELDAIILRLLAKRVAERPPGAAAVRQALLGLPRREPSRRPARRRPGLESLSGSPFVGRHAEMEELRRGLEEALAGRGRLFLLSGEPGSGKTRTAEELMSYARLRDVESLRGRCSEDEGAPAFWPWVQVLRSCCDARPADEIERILGPGAAEIAQLDPELEKRLSGVSLASRGPGWADLNRARFRLFDSLTTFFRNLSTRVPLLLVLDDLQWADEPSLRLLEFLSQGLHDARIMVLGSFRDLALDRSHPLTSALGEIARGGQARRVRLGGLSKEDVRLFVGISLGVGTWDVLASAVWRKSEGNPLFVSEIVRLFVTERPFDTHESGASWVIEMPPAVQSVIRRRLAQLSRDCHHVLTRAAVIGREFSLEVVERLSDLDGDRVIDTLEEAINHGVIDEQTGPDGRYVFTHDLIREALSRELSAARRARLHGRIAVILEDIYEESTGSRLADLAYHFSEAGTSGAAKACDYCGKAGERSMRQLAYEEAVRYYTMALDALAQVDRGDHARRCRFLLDQGEALRKLGDADGALRRFRAALDCARRGRLPEQLARAAMAVELTLWRSGDSAAPAVEILEESLGVLGERDSALRATCLGCLARALHSIGRAEEAVCRRQEAIEVARRVGDPAALVVVLYSLGDVWGSSNAESRLALSREIARLAERSGDIEQQLLAQGGLMWSLLELGDVVESRKAAHRCGRLAARIDQPFTRYVVCGYDASWAIAEGRFDEAEEVVRKMLEMGHRSRAENADWIYGVQMFSIRREQGRLQEIASTMRWFAREEPSTSTWRPGLAVVYAELDFRDEARKEFETLAASGFQDLPQSELWLANVSYLSDVCSYLDDTSRAKLLYEMLSPYAGRNMVIGGALACYGAVDRFLGELARTMGSPKIAADHFATALAMNARMGFRPWLARTQFQYARMLLERGGGVDSEKAKALLGGAVAISGELGMRGLEAAARQLQSSDPRPSAG